jgi:hypothetical protein
MDDTRIRQLTQEVLGQLAEPRDPVASDLEARVSALESAVRELGGAGARPSEPARAVVVRQSGHPALQLLSLHAGGEACVLEPDKPCVQSGQCRLLGH